MGKPMNKQASNSNIFMFDGGERYSNRFYKKVSHKADRWQAKKELDFELDFLVKV